MITQGRITGIVRIKIKKLNYVARKSINEKVILYKTFWKMRE